MKRLFIIAAAALLACSCSKESAQGIVPEEGNESVVYISLKTDAPTKAIGADHGTELYDNNVKRLDVFIFNNDGGEDDGNLDGYGKFSGTTLTSLINLPVKTTVGKKIIYVIANSHFDSLDGLKTRSEFESKTVDLFSETARNFLMVGKTEETLQLASSVTVSVKRLISRVKLSSVQTQFANTPYEGCSLTNVKAYLINVQGMKKLADGSGKDLKLLNSKKYVQSDMEGCSMDGMLYDEIKTNINDSGYSVSHYFYCYENDLAEEDDTDRFTRLVVEAQLQGKTYYYPVAIKNLKRNCSYSVGIKIQRPGSTDPDKDVEIGTLDISVEVEGWTTIEGSTVVF